MKDRKLFKVKIENNEKELYFKSPNQEELLALDLEYRRIFSHCLREGVMCEAEARKIAEKNNVWTKEDDKKISRIALEINVLESVVRNDDKSIEDAKIEEVVNKLSSLRAEMISCINQKVEILSNSAEGLSNQQRMHKFIQLCCYVSDGSRLFDNISSYENFVQNHQDVLSEIYKQAHLFEYGDPEKVTENWPEVQYIKNKIKEISENKDKNESIENTKEVAPKQIKQNKKKKEVVSVNEE